MGGAQSGVLLGLNLHRNILTCSPFKDFGRPQHLAVVMDFWPWPAPALKFKTIMSTNTSIHPNMCRNFSVWNMQITDYDDICVLPPSSRFFCLLFGPTESAFLRPTWGRHPDCRTPNPPRDGANVPELRERWKCRSPFDWRGVTVGDRSHKKKHPKHPKTEHSLKKKHHVNWAFGKEEGGFVVFPWLRLDVQF